MLKRTVVPFYGKINRRLDEMATRLSRAGRHEQAKEVRAKSLENLRKKSRGSK